MLPRFWDPRGRTGLVTALPGRAAPATPSSPAALPGVAQGLGAQPQLGVAAFASRDESLGKDAVCCLLQRFPPVAGIGRCRRSSEQGRQVVQAGMQAGSTGRAALCRAEQAGSTSRAGRQAGQLGVAQEAGLCPRAV